MSIAQTENGLSEETMDEIAVLATSISTNGVTPEQMNTQLRRIAEHAGVVVSIIIEQVVVHAERRMPHKKDHPSVKGYAAYQALTRFRGNKK